MESQTHSEILQRILYREFLLEQGLYLEVGRKDLPDKLAEALQCEPDQAIPELTQSPTLEALSMDQLRTLMRIHDMSLVSRTAASVTQELREPGVTYDQCIRRALSYGVIGSYGHMFSALRVASSHNDSWARHHYLYGIILGIDQNRDRARWELNKALQSEPFEDGRARIRQALEVIESE